MKALFCLSVLVLSLNALASVNLKADCLSDSDLQSRLSEIDNVLNQKTTRYSCNIVNIISGEMVMGAGQSVLVNAEKNSAEIVITNGFPPFAESVVQTLKLPSDNQAPRNRLVSANGKDAFVLTGEGTGTLSRKSTILGEERLDAFNCKAEDSNEE